MARAFDISTYVAYNLVRVSFKPHLDLRRTLSCPRHLSLERFQRNEHFENIYDLPIHYALDIHRVARMTALALQRVYSCDGVSTRQHNEPAGNQDVWHYHVHVMPRYKDDQY